MARRKYRYPDRASAEIAQLEWEDRAFRFALLAGSLADGDDPMMIRDRVRDGQDRYSIVAIARPGSGIHIFGYTFKAPGQRTMCYLIDDADSAIRSWMASGSEFGSQMAAALESARAQCQMIAIAA